MPWQVHDISRRRFLADMVSDQKYCYISFQSHCLLDFLIPSNHTLLSPMNQNDETSSATQPRWQPLDKIQRRVLGVLVEKAKTTQESYPLSLNALVSGCNQKSNRAPQMNLDADQVEEITEHLRKLGAMAVIQGGSRVDKYRHLLYEWLGVDKVELAVIGELLLRGAQTIGELRGRAARMEPIAGVSQLRPILKGLQDKGLIVYLTPPGRGCIVTHTLYEPQEFDRLRKEVGGGDLAVAVPHGPPPAASRGPVASEPEPMPEAPSRPVAAVESAVAAAPAAGSVDRAQFESLREEVVALRQQLAEFRGQTESSVDQLGRDLEDLNRQLGN